MISGIIGSDVIVIGAGIIGSACAFRLAERGLKVSLLERAQAAGEGSSGRSGAGVRVQFSEEVNVRLSWESIQEFQQFGERYGRSCGYVRNGYLFLVPEEQWKAHEQGVEVQRSVGAPVEVVTPEDAQRYVPFQTDGIYRCTYGPADGYIDPLLTLHAYREMMEEHGGSLYLNADALRVERAGEHWQVHTPRGIFTAPFIVNTSGAWSGEVGSRAGLQVPITPVKRCVYRTVGGNGQPSYPLTVDQTSNFWLRGHDRNVIFTISNPDQPSGLNDGMDWTWLNRVRPIGERRFPWLSAFPTDPARSFWGYYEMTPDGSPVLGPMPGVSGWFNACGFSGHGVQQCAATGRVITALLLGEPPPIDVSSLSVERFALQERTYERHIV